MKLDPQSIQEAIKEIVEDYKFEPVKVLEIIKTGIKAGFKKDYPEYKKADIVVNIDGKGNVKIYRQLEVVEEVENPAKEINLQDAKKEVEDIKIGDKILIDVTPSTLELSRIGTQTAAQMIKQELKKLEREKFYEKFKHKQGEILRAKVVRVQGDTVILDVDKVSVVLPTSGQIPQKLYEPGEEIFVYLKRIAKDKSGIVLDITQSSPEFVEAILKKIIPEVETGEVKIVKIARIPGKKTKVLVASDDERIDPVGVMVGYKGDRLNTILSLLDGEKIEFIEYTDDEKKLLQQLLKPAKVKDVEINGKKAYVYVAKGDKPLAIGKGAINVRLVSLLSGYTIEIVEE